MPPSDMSSDRPSTPQHYHHSDYNTNYEYYHSPPQSSPPQAAAPTYQEHASPTLETTVSRSATSDQLDDSKRHFSHGSEVGYAEMTNTEPQLVHPVSRGNEDKEAYRRSLLPGAIKTQPQSYSQPPKPMPVVASYHDEKERSRRRCGMAMPVFWLVMVIGAICILGLALGLGLGLGLKKHSSSNGNSNGLQGAQTLIGGAINPAYYSKSGAFNGSGVAIASVNQGTQADIFVFYQRYTGEIIQLYYGADGSWHFVTTVATNARNATPIAAVAYVYNHVATTHLFYLDSNNFIRQKITGNTTVGMTNIWYDGPLNNLNLQSHNSELVGMQACYWGNYYGSSTNFNGTYNYSTSQPQTGINLFYAKDNTTFDQYDWSNGQASWNYSHSFTGMNTMAGVGCQTWLNTTTQYLAMVDTTNTLRVIWRDTDLNKTSTAAHPINMWTQSSLSIPNIYPTSSLGYTDFLAYQSSDALLHGVYVNWAAENTSIATISANSANSASNPNHYNQWTIDTNEQGIPGTHMAITALNTDSGGRQLAVFYQSITDMGHGMTIGWRDSSFQGGWSYASVPVNTTA